MPQKKIYPETMNNGQKSQMKIIKARLLEISLKVDNYIYKQKPISKRQAKTFLTEIASFSSHCDGDIGYLQVIEKLTKYMKIIISSKKNTNKLNDQTDHTNDSKSVAAVLTINNDDNFLPAGSFEHDMDGRQGQKMSVITMKDNQNILNSNKICAIDFKSKYNDEQDTKNPNEMIDGAGLKEDLVIDNLAICNSNNSDINKNILNNYEHAKYKETADVSKIVNLAAEDVEKENKNEVPHKINKLDLQTNNKVGSNPTFENYVHEVVHVDKEVSNENMKAVSTKTGNQKNVLNASQAAQSEIQNSAHLNTKLKEINKVSISGEKHISQEIVNEEQNIGTSQVTNKSLISQNNNANKVIFQMARNENPTQTEIEMNTMFKGEIRKPDLTGTHAVNKLKMYTNPCKRNLVNKAQVKTKQDKPNKCSNKDENKTKINRNKTKIAPKNKIVKDNNILLSKLNSSASNSYLEYGKDLSWLDTIKYVREVDTQEYYTVVQGFDRNFWKNQAVPSSDDKEFKV